MIWRRKLLDFVTSGAELTEEGDLLSVELMQMILDGE